MNTTAGNKLMPIDRDSVLGPLSNESIKDMRDILRRIEKGQYQHKQNSWHCGTAHCFAGWKETRDSIAVVQIEACEKKKAEVLEVFHIQFQKKYCRMTSQTLAREASINEDAQPTWLGQWREEMFSAFKFVPMDLYDAEGNGTATSAYAQLAWGLTNAEKEELFAGGNSLEDLKRMVEKFAKGLRFGTYVKGTDDWDSGWADPKEVKFPAEDNFPHWAVI